MSKESCVILFDQNDYCTYFTGQVVSGRVIISLNKPKKFKGIKLEICGFACCQWRQRHGRKRPCVKVNPDKLKKHVFYGREDYIASTTYLVGSEEGQNFTMDAGIFTYTFACPIPINCPSSFEGAYGHVRYLARVVYMRVGASNRSFNVGFTVLKNLDLNQESRLLKSPANNEAIENFCLMHTKAVHLHVDIMQTGYVPGQFILVSANVKNESGFDCKKLAIYLNLRATYTAFTPQMRSVNEKICLVQKFCGPVPRETQRNFAETLRVPATPPTSEHLCKVVRISYEICVEAVMNTFMPNPKTKIPITIGNVPFCPTGYADPPSLMRRMDENLPTTSMAALQLTTDDEDGDEDFEEIDEEEINEDNTAAGTVSDEPELPPPTYEEAMFMTTNIADVDVNTVSQETTFTPRYPVYDVDGLLAANGSGLSPPPNPPQKRRRRRKRRGKNMMPQESPIEI